MSKSKPITGKQLLKVIFGAVMAALLVVFVSGHYTNLPKGEVDLSAIQVITGIKDSITSTPMKFTPIDWGITKVWLTNSGVIGGFAFLFMFSQEKEKKRVGEEHGSASWLEGAQRKAFNLEFTNTEKEEKKAKEIGHGNRILSHNMRLTNNGRKLKGINNNEIVIGGSGTGKSRFYVKPNVLQANGSYIITDPAGELLHDTGSFLEEEGYKVKVFNLVQMDKSSGYNPFMYIRTQDDVLRMVNTFMENTDSEGTSKGDAFWVKSESMFLSALVNYLIETYPITEDLTEEERVFNMRKQSFPEVLELMKLETVDEDNPDEESELSLLMADLYAKNPESAAVENYQGFKSGAGKTLKSIIITARARLAPFTSSPSLKELMREDDLDLAMVGSEKTALFIITPIADKTYNFVASMMYSQLFDTLYHKSETEYNGGELPIQVNFYIDEFANLGKIPNFEMILSTVRKYGINVKVILQSMSQLKSMYKDDWEGIVGNCSTLIYLGGNEQSTHEYISKKLGKETITSTTSSRSYSKTDSRSSNKAILGRELMTSDEIGMLDRDKSIVIVSGIKPIMDKKFDYPTHKNYKRTADHDKKNSYLIKIKEKSKPDDNVANSAKRLEGVPIKTFSFMSEFRKPEILEFNDILGEDQLEQVRSITYFIKEGGIDDIKQEELFNKGFKDFVINLETNHL